MTRNEKAELDIKLVLELNMTLHEILERWQVRQLSNATTEALVRGMIRAMHLVVEEERMRTPIEIGEEGNAV